MSRILPIIVGAQFCCTSLWFAGNAVAPDMAARLHLGPGFVPALTSAVQLGFIAGTLTFALLAVADRFSPSRVFCLSAVAAACCNLGLVLPGLPEAGLLTCRVLTGFFLAGIYPVGMKIAADYYAAGLARSLGWLVGALVLGTAFPHLLKSLGGVLPWQVVAWATSSLALLGGLALVLLVPDGPYRRPGQRPRITAFLAGFRDPAFRAAAFGYFGHMWELYTFWAFVPVVVAAFNSQHPSKALPVALASFAIIGVGSLACVGAGLLAQQLGPRRVATGALALSGSCCLASGAVLAGSSAVGIMVFLVFWGVMVVADSPMFSTLVAQYAPAETRGAALTIVNCVGFAITIVSVQLTGLLAPHLPPHALLLPLVAGPVLGLWGLRRGGA